MESSEIHGLKLAVVVFNLNDQTAAVVIHDPLILLQGHESGLAGDGNIGLEFGGSTVVHCFFLVGLDRAIDIDITTIFTLLMLGQGDLDLIVLVLTFEQFDLIINIVSELENLSFDIGLDILCDFVPSEGIDLNVLVNQFFSVVNFCGLFRNEAFFDTGQILMSTTENISGQILIHHHFFQTGIRPDDEQAVDGLGEFQGISSVTRSHSQFGEIVDAGLGMRLSGGRNASHQKSNT